MEYFTVKIQDIDIRTVNKNIIYGLKSRIQKNDRNQDKRLRPQIRIT